MSAQQAELSAVVYVVTHPEIFPTPYTICSDSMFTCNSCTEYLAIWSRRGYTSADWRPLTVKPLLEKILAAVGEEGEVFIHKVKAHSSAEPRSEGNRQADVLAKEGTRTGTFWDPYGSRPIAAVTGRNGTQGSAGVALTPDLKMVQTQDPVLKAALSAVAEGKRVEGPYSTAAHSVKEDMLFKGEQWVVPQQHRREFLQLAHEGPGAGHPGPETTWQRVEQAGWWPGLREDVREFCASCLVCAANNPDPRKRKVPMGHIRRVEGPWQSIQVDNIGPLPTAQGGYKYCLVLVDMFTKWVEAFPCRTATALSTARILVREVVSRWGLPQYVESNQGSHFTGQVMQNNLMILGIEGKWHVAHNPQSSGIVERMNRTLKERLRKETVDSPRKWVEVLPLVLMGIRASQSKSTGYSPHELMTGRVMRTPTHVLAPVLTEGQLREVNRDSFVRNLFEHLKQVHWQAASNMGKQHRSNRLLLEPRTHHEWEIGDQVMVRNFARVGSLEPLYMGPYSIVDEASPMVYDIKLPRRTKWFHINQCKLFKSERREQPVACSRSKLTDCTSRCSGLF
ncbi:protein NYNRIN-like [Heptranchias perlo]|uniref:protein NYNRIN-like n=1 Tax=Heptranchias perlo TaxID=212740 RepID=UPI0035598AE9